LDEVAYHILKYISYEGRLSVVYGYHFILLHELEFQAKFPLAQRLSVPYFLLQPIRDMIQKVREGKHQNLGHHRLIKLIMVDSLNKIRIPILWSKFIGMDREAFIDIETLTRIDIPTSSVGGREGKEEEEEGEKIEQERETYVERTEEEP